MWERLTSALARFGGLFLEKLDEISLSYNKVFSVVGTRGCPSQHFSPLNGAEDTSSLWEAAVRGVEGMESGRVNLLASVSSSLECGLRLIEV